MVTNRGAENQLAVAIRALAALAAEPTAVLTSERMADAIGAHPVVLRRILGRLRSDGVVEGRSGPRGGWALARDPAQLPLGRVLRALRADASRAAPPDDLVGRTLRSATDAYERELDRVTLADVLRDPHL
jgi:Rrf2 family protein